MSGFTTQIRTLIEHYSQDDPSLPLDEKIEQARKEIFNFSYPFFDPDYKQIFETNFIKYFYMYEIGQETEGLFKFRLDTWLNVNMFYYNKLFESDLLKYDPMENYNRIKEKKRNNNVMESDTSMRKGKADSTTNSTSNQEEKQNSTQSEKQKNKQSDEGFVRDIQSDTPESRLQITANDDGTGVIPYASSIGENKSIGNTESSGDKTGEMTDNRVGESSGQSTGISNMTNEEKRDKTLSECETDNEIESGKIGGITYPEMIQLYRETFINVERKLFENMRKDGLFMLVYS